MKLVERHMYIVKDNGKYSLVVWNTVEKVSVKCIYIRNGLKLIEVNLNDT